MYTIGTVCIGQNFKESTYRNGMECEIVGGLQDRLIGSVDGVPYPETIIKAYKVRWTDGNISACAHEYLRPKHYPGSWDELESTIGWNPSKQLTTLRGDI